MRDVAEQQAEDAGCSGDSRLEQKQHAASKAYTTGKYEEAALLFTEALQLLERSSDAPGCAAGHAKTDTSRLAAKLLSNRSACWSSAGDHAAALLDAIAARKQTPEWSRPLLREAQALAGLGRLQAALSVVRQALDLDPGDGQAKQLAVHLLRKQTQPQPAQDCLANSQQHKQAAARSSGSSNPVAVALSMLDAAGVRHAPIPVTIVGGFLGAGKTSLVRHVLQQCAAPLHTGGGSSAAAGQEDGEQWGTGADCRPLKTGKVVGVLVNDMSAVNIDAELLSAAPHASAANHVGIGASPAGPLAALSNGCVCCDLRGDLITQVAAMVMAQPALEAVVIEVTGVGEVLPVAAAFFVHDGSIRSVDGGSCNTAASPVRASASDGGTCSARTLADYLRVDTLVVVVDTPTIMSSLGSSLPSAGTEMPKILQRTDQAALAAGAAAQPTPACTKQFGQLLAEQVECADVVVLNKCDLLTSPQQLDEAEAAVAALNPRARRIHTTHGHVMLQDVLATGRFDVALCEQGPAWAASLLGINSPSAASGPSEAAAYGIASCSFSARRPFHPRRLWDAVHGPHPHQGCSAGAGATATLSGSPRLEHMPVVQHLLPPLLRSKGFFWLASMPEFCWEWSTAGTGCRAFHPTGRWLASMVPQELWPRLARSRPNWDDVWGDRVQRLAFIGDASAVPSQVLPLLEACLLTDSELEAGAEAWALWDDPWVDLLECLDDEDKGAGAAPHEG